MEFLAIDDQLLLQDGLLGQLSEKDLDQALEERGMSVYSGSLYRFSYPLWTGSHKALPSRRKKLGCSGGLILLDNRHL